MQTSGPLRFIYLVLITCFVAKAQAVLTPGAGKEVVQRMCSGCHAVDVAISTTQTRDRWQNIVEDMVARGAKGSDQDIRAVVNYLASNYGKTGGTSTTSTTTSKVSVANAPIAKDSANRDLTVIAKVSEANQWPSYGHDPGGQRFSPVTQITPQNVGKLTQAWTFHTGKTGSESTPLVIDSVMYVTAPDAIYALEPETGKQIWKYASEGVARRGLAYWPGSAGTPARIFCGVQTGQLVALDALTGKPTSSFGDNGLVDLRRGMTERPDEKLYLASPPSIYKNVVITGSNNGELAPSGGAYGDVRGWDTRTGKLLWTFHTVPRTGEPGNETWAPDSWKNRSGTNVWGLITVDVERGLVFLPIGCPTSDMYGADRKGDGLYGNSLVALDARTGTVKWYRQLVHHDLWDYDVAAPPSLIDVVRNGKKTAAVAQITKMSTLFIFDRTTGEPIFGMEERKVAQSKVPGEASSPTQPFPLKPPPLSRMFFTKEDLYSSTPEHAAFCRDLFEKNKMFTEGPFTPMPLEGNALTFPSTLGGGNWGGLSYDPNLGYVFTNIMNLGQWGHMVLKTDANTGEKTYTRTAAFGGAYGRFWDPDSHVPCQKPPFGELVAVNVNTGDIAWRVPLGIMDAMEAKGVRGTGTLSMGGSIATAAGLVFIAATNDSRIRAFASRSGEQLWAAKLEASAYAVPITYQGRDGRQYVAVVAGGGGFWASGTGDSVVAFALP